jgi:hypothetical protein
MGSEAANDAASASASAGGSGGGGNATDTGDLGSEAANDAATAAANAAAGLGGANATDPDPNVEDPVDSISNLAKNVSAAIQSNPIGFALSPLGVIGLTTARTIAANVMMSNPSTTSTSSTATTVTEDTNQFGNDGGDTFISTVAPYLIGGTEAQPSQVLQYFSNLQNQPQAEGLLSRYDQAKQNVSGILGTNNQLGASNTSNFYYNYLNQRGLL